MTQAVLMPNSNRDFEDLVQRVAALERIVQRPQLFTSLPSVATVGQVIRLQTTAMAAMSPPVSWKLYYDGSKWIPDGDATPLWSEVGSVTAGFVGVTEQTAITTYTTLTTPGPSIDLPAAGDYSIEISFWGYHSAAGALVAMSYDIGGTGAVDADAAVIAVAVATTDILLGRMERRKTGLSAVTLTSKYKNASGSGTASFRGYRSMKVTPIRLG